MGRPRFHRESTEHMNRRTSRRIPALPSWLPVDPYILALIGTVVLAALLPVSGTGADVAGGASTGAVALLFFLYGARLSTAEALDGLKHWRLHLTVLACTFLVFPLFGLASHGLVPYVLTPSSRTASSSCAWCPRPSSRRSPSPRWPAATCPPPSARAPSPASPGSC